MLFDDALEVAMTGLRIATDRVGDACATGSSELTHAVIETLWWQKSVEDLWEEEEGEAYYRRRDASDGGVAVGGLAYARNAGGHRVGRTYDEVVYRAASTVESMVLAFPDADAELRWPPLGDLPPLPMEDPFDRPAMYSEQVAGRPLLDPLHAALAFFEEMLRG